MRQIKNKIVKLPCAISDEELDEHLKEFNPLYPDDFACLDFLFKLKFTEQVECRHCWQLGIPKRRDKRTFECESCKKVFSGTADTFFAHTRLVRPLFLAIWLMERGIVISAHRFHKVAKVVDSTAHLIFKKITYALNKSMKENAEFIDSNALREIYSRRSRKTDADQHPSMEQTKVQQSANGATEDSDRDIQTEIRSRLDDTQKLVFDCLSDTPLHIDKVMNMTALETSFVIANLTLLELENLVEALPGSRYIQKRVMSSKTASIQSQSVDPAPLIAFIQQNFFGISRKYAQLHLAALWCYFNKHRWSEHRLFRLLIGADFVSYKNILDYESPLSLTVFPLNKNCAAEMSDNAELISLRTDNTEIDCSCSF